MQAFVRVVSGDNSFYIFTLIKTIIFIQSFIYVNTIYIQLLCQYFYHSDFLADDLDDDNGRRHISHSVAN